jgi:hypothetical protein
MMKKLGFAEKRYINQEAKSDLKIVEGQPSQGSNPIAHGCAGAA